MDLYESLGAAARDVIGDHRIDGSDEHFCKLTYSVFENVYLMVFENGDITASLDAITVDQDQAKMLCVPPNTTVYALYISEYEDIGFFAIEDVPPHDRTCTQRFIFTGFDTAKAVWSALANCYTQQQEQTIGTVAQGCTFFEIETGEHR